MRRILFILFAALLAWHFGDAVIALLVVVVPPLGSLLLNLAPDISGRSFGQYFFWVIETILVWALLKGIFALTGGIVLPGAQRFGTTKLLRRIQGVLYNFLLLFDIHLIVCVIFMLVLVGPPATSLEDHELKREAMESPVSSVVSLMFLRLLGPNHGSAIRQLAFNHGNDPMPFFLSLVLFIVLQRFLKSRLGKIYPPVIRFFQIGRFGMGGSGRFAGQIEEWGLRWRRGRGLEALAEKWEARRKLWWANNRDQNLRLKHDQAVGDGLVETEGETAERLNIARARMADIEQKKKDLAAAQAKAAGNTTLFMGRSLYSRFLHVGLEGDQHMLTVASSRSGKGVSCIIPNLLTFTGSVVCVDPKGTNAAVTAQRRKAMGQNVYVIDPFNIVTKHLGMEQSDGFNPLSMLDPDSVTIREDIEVITEALVVPPPTGHHDPHWDEGAKTIISGLIAHLITQKRTAEEPPPGLPDLRKLMKLPADKQDRMWAEMAVNMGAGGLASDGGMRVIQGAGSEEMQGFFSSVNKHTEWLGGPAMKDVLTRTSFNFAEIKERPTTIYLVIPMHYLSRHRRFLRLFINLAMLQMSKGGRSPHPVLAILDEFLALGPMQEIVRGFRELAGYNLILWPFVQQLSGLQRLYGADYDAFIGNARSVQMFALTSNDQAGIDYAMKEVGERSMSYIFGVESLKTTPLRTPKEVTTEISKRSNCQYVLTPGEPPLLLEKVKYYEDAAASIDAPFYFMPVLWKLYPFRGLYGKDPDY